MLPRRRSKNTTPSYASQQQAGSSVDGGRRPDLVTNKVPHRGPTAQTLITESPVSESSPLEPPPPILMPPRAIPPLPSRRPTPFPSGPFRRTVESYDSTSEPTSPQPESGPAHRETAGVSEGIRETASVSEGIHAGVWPTYNKVSQEFDEKWLKQWNEDLDVLLIFAALFSAIVTAFLIRALDDLGPNYQQQSVLLLHQLLNGRDPNLANISDPTILQRPTNSAIAVNCLWFASLLTSLFASLCAIICKGWLTEYAGGTNPVVGLLRACRRHVRFMALQQLNVQALVAFLPVLLHSSVLLFFAGAVVYLLQMDKRVAIVFIATGGVLGAAYFALAILPFVTIPPFRHYSTFFLYRIFVTTGFGEVVVPIVDVCYLTLCYAIITILWPLYRCIDPDDETRYTQVMRMITDEYKSVRTWWAHARRDLLDETDTGQRIQEEAILWLSQVPLVPSESKALISSLALISSSRPYGFKRPLIGLLNSVLEASLREGGGGEQTDVAIDCVIVLGNIKFQSVVDLNSDHDHDVGGIPVPTSVAWAAQKLLAGVQKADSGTPHSEGIRERLLAATIWLSPAEIDASKRDGGENLRIQDRWKFLWEIEEAIQWHICGENPLDTKILVTLIRGMHAINSRRNYWIGCHFPNFLPLLCEDYASPWSEDEDVLRALITYVLDFISGLERRRPLVERNIEFRDLALELIDVLKINLHPPETTWFGFWLVCRVPYLFKSRRTIATDIDRTWVELDKGFGRYDCHERSDLHAIRAFATVVKQQVVDNGASQYPCHINLTDLTLPSAALKFDSSRPTAVYAISMILNLSPPAEVSPPNGGASVESIIGTMFLPGGGDIERNVVEEDVVDLYIYSALILLKLSPRPELDVEKLMGLIARVGNVIEAPFTEESEAAQRSEVEIHADLGRVRWKAIYISALLFKLLPGDQTEEHKERLGVRVRELLESRALSLAKDCYGCLEPLAMEVPQSGGDQQEQGYTVFEAWVQGFPLLSLKEILGRKRGWGTLRGMPL